MALRSRRVPLLIVALAALGLAANAPARQRSRAQAGGVVKQRINPPGLAKPQGYAHVVAARGGRTVYIAGQVALDAAGNVVGKGDLEAQARKVFENLRTALRSAGAGFDDVVKLNTYVVNYRPEMLDALRGVRSAFLGDVAVPASTLLGVQALAREGLLIEIEAVAVVPDHS
jgi:enamine deaminase RidA (YjgF/YER057c/UK114 family)